MTPQKPSEKAKNPEQNLGLKEEIGYLHTEEGKGHIIKVVKEDILKQENKTLYQTIAHGSLIISIVGAAFIGLLSALAGIIISYHSLQREFLQTKIEQQNERIKQLEQKQNLVLSAKK